MKKILANPYLLLAARLLIGFIFILSGVEKAADTGAFAEAVANYQILPRFLVNLTAVTLPWIELTAGLLMLMGIRVKENSALLSALLFIFIVAIAASMIRGLDINCGCFGTADQQVGFQKIAENTLLLLFGIQLIFFENKLLVLRN